MDTKNELKKLMNERGYSTLTISQKVGIGKSTVSMYLNDKYTGNTKSLDEKFRNFIKRECEQLLNEDLPIVDISIVKYISEIARLSHTKGRIGVCAGRAGLGKTVAVKEYRNKYIDSILIESDSGYTAKALLLEIHKKLGLSGKGCAYELMNEVVNKLRNSGRLLIIDEAENLPYRALEITRRIHDKTGIGILLVGTNDLLENLRGLNNQYEQLYSRVTFHKVLDDINIKDVIKILEASGQNPELASSYLRISNGNTRRLEHLISQSVSVARANGTEVDDAVIMSTSKLLMEE